MLHFSLENPNERESCIWPVSGVSAGEWGGQWGGGTPEPGRETPTAAQKSTAPLATPSSLSSTVTPSHGTLSPCIVYFGQYVPFRFQSYGYFWIGSASNKITAIYTEVVYNTWCLSLSMMCGMQHGATVCSGALSMMDDLSLQSWDCRHTVWIYSMVEKGGRGERERKKVENGGCSNFHF